MNCVSLPPNQSRTGCWCITLFSHVLLIRLPTHSLAISFSFFFPMPTYFLLMLTPASVTTRTVTCTLVGWGSWNACVRSWTQTQPTRISGCGSRRCRPRISLSLSDCSHKLIHARARAELPLCPLIRFAIRPSYKLVFKIAARLSFKES